jgi:hypothetical protein
LAADGDRRSEIELRRRRAVRTAAGEVQQTNTICARIGDVSITQRIGGHAGWRLQFPLRGETAVSGGGIEPGSGDGVDQTIKTHKAHAMACGVGDQEPRQAVHAHVERGLESGVQRWSVVSVVTRYPAARDGSHHAIGVDRPHAQVGARKVYRPFAIHGDGDRLVDLSRLRGPVISQRTGDARARDSADEAVAGHHANAVVAGVGDVQIPITVGRDPIRLR